MKQVLSAVLFVCVCSSISFSGGFLRVTGKSISNDNGTIQLRGIGIGGWLVPEGYMLQTSGFANSPTEIRNKIVSLIGQANADSFYSVYRKNFVTKADIDRIAEWGFNSIRLPMHYDLLTPKDQPGVFSEQGFAIIDSILSWCEQDHIYLILDLHCAPGGQNSANISDYISGEPSLWESTENQTRTVALWKKIAERYHDKEWIGGYDLLNETVWNLPSNNQPLHDLFVSITAAIREVDTSHIVYIEGNNWANDFTGLGTPWDTKMVYSFHKYWNSNDLGSISSFLSLRNSANRPLWLGESGENSNQWFADCIALMESNDIGWSWWTYKKIDATNAMLNVVKTADYNTLLKYWNGSGSKPSADAAFQALLNQAEKFKLDQCQPCPDVIDAIFRLPFTNATVPYSDNTVPGKILGIHYDMGKNGSAYSDADYQNTNNSSSWNSGGQYRNDGVDIETCNDLFSGGYDIGWINANEYLKFTFTSPKESGYSVTARVAAQNAGGQILTQIDDSIMVGVGAVPATGGYQTWKTIPVGTCHLTQGQHKLRLYFLSGGFNLTYVEFLEAPTDIKINDRQPYHFSLSQNYPNPCNPTASIRYQIASPCNVTIRLSDILGNTIATLIDRQQEAGSYTVPFDGSRYASGMYFYTIRAGSFSQTKKLILVR